jgi:hypothetical protein
MDCDVVRSYIEDSEGRNAVIIGFSENGGKRE